MVGRVDRQQQRWDESMETWSHIKHQKQVPAKANH